MMGITLILISSKDVIGETAPFNGWSPEREKLAYEWSKRDGMRILDSLMSVWKSLKPLSNNRFLDEEIKRLGSEFIKDGDVWKLVFIAGYIEDARRLIGVKDSYAPNMLIRTVPFKKSSYEEYELNDGNGWTTMLLSNTAVPENKPSVVQVGETDTLFAAFEVSDCSSVCSVSHTNSCIAVKYSYDQGATWNPAFCIESASGNIKHPSITADNYRRIITVVYSYEKTPTDNDIGGFTFWAGDFTKSLSYWIDTSGDNTISPSAKYTTNLGEPSCENSWIATCSCTLQDNKLFVAATKVDSLGEASGIRVYRSEDCAATWLIVYEGPQRKGSAYMDDNQVYVAVGNYPLSSSSVCGATYGGENTIHIVYAWRNSSTEHRIEHLFTDPSKGWGSVWVSTTVFSGLFYPVSQPTIAVARTNDTANMPHFITFEIRYGPSDGDIYFIYKGSFNSSWSLGNVEKSSYDSRTPFVISDAENLACPGLKTSSSSKFHITFYHVCDPTNWLCSSSSYNGTYRVVAVVSPWDSPGMWQPEYCNGDADYTIIPPPPSYPNGGYWQDWRNIYPVVYRRGANLTTPWWLGVLWVYNDSTTNNDVYWTASDCALGSDDELSADESENAPMVMRIGKYVHIMGFKGYISVYSEDGRMLRREYIDGEKRIPLKRGVWFIKLGRKAYKVLLP